MTTQSHTFGWTYRLGKGASHALRSYVRLERLAATWLVKQGIPAGGVAAVVWMLRLLTVGGAAYLSFWLASLLGCLVAFAWTANAGGFDSDERTEWRTGVDGFGLYRGDIRIDIGDPYEEN
ncbi:DUF3742 family protein [Acidovorax sp. SUPP3334]|uniref:DUF3742 family protein n=1 Tax=Acidovorax sp. SUPP3334 TaxID=2920881 RepID=UPI0023DE2AD9|nr:DUF3742 family protein [Acidovorax sp. SUPP3334]GKT26858.1 DUF3742 family protein [Acidovorax sp. SUPP3334]